MLVTYLLLGQVIDKLINTFKQCLRSASRTFDNQIPGHHHAYAKYADHAYSAQQNGINVYIADQGRKISAWNDLVKEKVFS